MVKKKQKKQQEKPDIYYVGIQDPIELRRSLLESSREMVQYLQRFERFKKVRAEKAEEIAKLKQDMKEIAKLVRKVKFLLPKTQIRTKLHRHEDVLKQKELVKEIKELKTAPPAPKKKEKELKMPEKKGMTELEKLEAELSEIESRLTNLS